MAIPQLPIDKLLQPVNRFIHGQYTSGLVLLLGVIMAIVWVNSPFAASYHHFWEIELSLSFDHYELKHPLHIWINDGLMAIFFFRDRPRT